MTVQSVQATGETRQAISRGMVAIYKRQLGRGPSTARTFINDDVVTVILEDNLTSVEHTLVDNDRGDVVENMRRGFQMAVRDEIVGLVEEATGHEVRAFMSDHTVMPDFAVECFVLGPKSPGLAAKPPAG
jgi:uncharacterized protein YbcI